MFGFLPHIELSILDVVPEHGLHLHLHSELRNGTRSVSGNVFHFLRLPCWLCHLTDVLRVFPSAGVTGVLPTEIFNQTARPAAYMIAGSMMWINLFITGMLFPFLVVSLCFCQQENTHTQSVPYNVNTMIYLEYKCTTDIPVAIPLRCYMY